MRRRVSGESCSSTAGTSYRDLIAGSSRTWVPNSIAAICTARSRASQHPGVLEPDPGVPREMRGGRDSRLLREDREHGRIHLQPDRLGVRDVEDGEHLVAHREDEVLAPLYVLRRARKRAVEVQKS